jgi:catechol 2,3-dioxygenase-like lactoylglutathione lyase family enzyme
MTLRLNLVAVLVRDYDEAINFFVERLGFQLVDDLPAVTNDRRRKRWVVVRPPGGGTGLLLARADGERQLAAVGAQFAGRVGFFLEVGDFEREYARLVANGVRFASLPRTEPYGKVAVFIDVAGNRWDLIGPAG